jgi:uncharacterized flavoprotein (TIGR03862 family)
MRDKVAIIGGGPAGLMAAQALGGGVIFEAMPTVGRKFLLAGRGGLNLTHSEPLADFLTRYGAAGDRLGPLLHEFGPSEVMAWCQDLGFETFVGSSRRVFPKTMKAAPLLRAWLARLGVEVRTRHRWLGWDSSGALCFETPHGTVSFQADATVLALGGASWPRMGSTGAWVPLLRERGVEVRELEAANVGYEVEWSSHFAARFAGQPVKSVAMSFGGRSAQGEFVITSYGVEGSLVYPFGPLLRDRLPCSVLLDLLPATALPKLEVSLARERGSRSLAKHLRQRAGIEGVKLGLVNEFLRGNVTAAALKALPLPLLRPRPVEEAISTAGGVALENLDDAMMLRKLPGVFCAGEMLDWEAPTGGYLLTASFATGRAAGLGVRRYLETRS